jgi:hypothetical protein
MGKSHGNQRISDDFAILLRLHYTSENFLTVAEFGRRINDTFGSDPRFKVFFKCIARLGGPNDESITPVSKQERAAIEAFLWQATRLNPSLDSVEDYVCYAGKVNSLVIRSTLQRRWVYQ